jgi:5-methylcytosine-specific restriction endonuclease McrA
MAEQPSKKTIKIVYKSSNGNSVTARTFTLVKRKDFVAPIDKRQCKTCHNTFDLTRDNFGSTPNDNFRWQCRSCMRNHVKSYSQENPNAAKARSELRKEREDGAKAIDDKVKSYLLKKFQNQCAYCGIDLIKKFHVDHIIPIAKNGSNAIENLAVCCIKCNLAKHAKTPEEFYAWMERKKIKFRLPKLI